MYKRIYVEIGNICNLRCSFCPPVRRAKRQMSVEEFEIICQKIKPHTDYILLHVMGEPLLHPKLDAILNIAGKYGFRVGITTNGTLLDRCSQVLLDHSDVIHRISISLHSAEGNERSLSDTEHNGASNERSLSDAAHSLPTPHSPAPAPASYLQTAISFAGQAATKGIYIVFRLWNLDSAEGKGANRNNLAIEDTLHLSFPDEWGKRYSGYRLAQNIFLEYDGIFTWPTESNAEEIEEGFCHGATSQLAVLADGTVVPCCLDSEGEIVLGNLFNQNMEEILSSERLQNMCKGFQKRIFVEPLCQKCTYARRFG